MSYNRFQGPFVKEMHTSFYPTRDNDSAHPLFGVSFNVPVPVPNRRVNTLIQNQGTTEVTLGFDFTGSVLTGGCGVKLYAGQSITFDDFNGPIFITGTSPTLVSITESFA